MRYKHYRHTSTAGYTAPDGGGAARNDGAFGAAGGAARHRGASMGHTTTGSSGDGGGGGAAAVQRSVRRGLQHFPTFSRLHPDANPGARPNADINLGKKSLRGDTPSSTLPRAWKLQRTWPSEKAHAITGAGAGLMATEVYGQVTGIDVDTRGRIWVLQRTPERKWDASAFSMQHQIRYKSPIRGNTIVRYPSEDATEIDLATGANVFQMPHMITVDGPGNVWVVDCGLHQVLTRVGASGEVDFTATCA